jgi:hypothetical protein
MSDTTQLCTAYQNAINQITAQRDQLEQNIVNANAAFAQQMSDIDAQQAAARATFDAQMAKIDADQVTAQHAHDTAITQYDGYLALLTGQETLYQGLLDTLGCD